MLLSLAPACFATAPTGSKIRGKLATRDGKPVLELSDHRVVSVDGDESTRGILNDKRLAGADIEADGHFADSETFQVDPIHTKALHVFKGGKRYSISYWCATCSIRTYTPGTCVCCQAETALDLQDEVSK